MKVGDLVEIIHPSNNFGCKITGTIVSFYNSEMANIKTKAGHEWTIKKDRLRKANYE